eukprot:scaffold74757_cov55-Phaeocystis_antarctica.AAC.1
MRVPSRERRPRPVRQHGTGARGAADATRAHLPQVDVEMWVSVTLLTSWYSRPRLPLSGRGATQEAALPHAKRHAPRENAARAVPLRPEQSVLVPDQFATASGPGTGRGAPHPGFVKPCKDQYKVDILYEDAPRSIVDAAKSSGRRRGCRCTRSARCRSCALFSDQCFFLCGVPTGVLTSSQSSQEPPRSPRRLPGAPRLPLLSRSRLHWVLRLSPRPPPRLPRWFPRRASTPRPPPRLSKQANE